jgi:asparagine synthase (glutamine-hydrolysing)
MSIQFGRWNFEDRPPAPDYVERVSAALAPYGPDSNESYSKGGINILYRAFHTTKESRREKQPRISPFGAVITWDGRLDNRADLISELRDSLRGDSTDVAIVAGAYEKWGANCLEKLLGDWALSIWNPRERSVLLAKDPIGTKHLYYSFDDKQLTWSTILDPLVLFAGKTFEICEEYIAGWFAIVFPAVHLTPYVGIHAVPPSSSVLIRPGKHIVSKYWDFDPDKRIHYRTDAEYEEHFRSTLATAVQRRLRSDRPVLAELSGGMDSSSVVCVADTVIARGIAETSRLDTVSWYDESEPNWGERPCFTKVEEKRGRIGCHIDFGRARQRQRVDSPHRIDPGFLLPEFENDRLAATPFYSSRVSEPFNEYEAYVRLQGYRVTLSGIGGEVATGGVPNPSQELQNLIATAHFVTLARQLNAWAVKMRKPQLSLLLKALRGFFRPAELLIPAPWLDPGFVRRNRTVLRGYPSRITLFGPLPSFQDQIRELNSARRSLACCSLHSGRLREVRYPFLDRNLLEFAYAIPREQLVRVGERRSLMKRALVGIVPDEVLNRRKNRPVSPDRPGMPSTAWPSVAEIGQYILTSSIGIVDLNRFMVALQKATRNEETSVKWPMQILTLELWLRNLTIQGVLPNTVPPKSQECSSSSEGEHHQVQSQAKSSVS